MKHLSQSPSHPLLEKLPAVKQFEIKPEKKSRKLTAKKEKQVNVVPVIGFESDSASGGRSPKLVSGAKVIGNQDAVSREYENLRKEFEEDNSGDENIKEAGMTNDSGMPSVVRNANE